ncbi:MAG: low molecular weight protein-tyrosine-phosphatase, partial [Bacteroidales bacterium]
MENKKISLLFVCLGNICRSPSAEAIMKHIVKKHGTEDTFIIDSAGLYGGHAGSLPDQRMRTHAARRGYQLLHKARSVTTNDFSEYDLIIAMDDGNYANLQSIAPTVEARNKVVRMADYLEHYQNDTIPDPYYGGADGFENVLNLLE